VDLPGTHWLRVSPMENGSVDGHCQRTQAKLLDSANGSGPNSSSLWSGVPAAEEKKINTWPFLWSYEVEKNELPRLRQQNQGCVLISSEVYLFWKDFANSKSNDELLSEVRKTMKPIFTLQDVILTSSQKPNAPANSAAATDQRYSIP
jgi:hypothetical protein